MTFAERIKVLRKEKGLTQTQLAAELDVSGGTVAMWETGKRRPSMELVDRICDYFTVSYGYLLGTEDEKRTYDGFDKSIPELGRVGIEDYYARLLENFSLLDDFGRKSVIAQLNAEFDRCKEQGTLRKGVGHIGVSLLSAKDFQVTD